MLETDVCFYIKKLSQHTRRHMHTLYSRKELDECTMINMWVADYLYHRQDGPVFQKDIESEFMINRATASKMLKLMEDKKLIRRTADCADSRLKKIELEPKGYALQKLCEGIRREMEAYVTAPLTEEETMVFKSLCLKMLQGLEGCKKQRPPEKCTGRCTSACRKKHDDN